MTPALIASLAPGSGRLVRRSSMLLFSADPESEMVAAFDTADNDDVALTAVKQHLVDATFEAEPIVVARWDSASVDLLVFGPIEVHSSAAAVPMITGAGSASWVERRLGSFELGSSDAAEFWCGVEAYEGTDLRDGIAAADGFHLSIPLTTAVPVDEPDAAVEPAEPPAAVPADQPDAAVEVSEPPAAVPVEQPVPAPPAPKAPTVESPASPFDVPPEPASAPPVASQQVGVFDEGYEETEVAADEAELPATQPPEAESMSPLGLVEAVLCESGHPNRPGAAACSSCEVALAVDAPISLIAQPAVGLVVFMNGQRLVVDRPVVLGRKPIAPDPQSSAMAIDEPEVSREHAVLGVDGWTAHLTDSGSRNGTYVIAPETTAPVRLDDGVQYVLEHGTTVHLGGPEVAFRFLAEILPVE